MSELQLAIELEKERKRSTRYFERMKSDETSLASIRARLGMSNKSTPITLQRIDDLNQAAYNWFASCGELNDADTN